MRANSLAFGLCLVPQSGQGNALRDSQLWEMQIADPSLVMYAMYRRHAGAASNTLDSHDAAPLGVRGEIWHDRR